MGKLYFSINTKQYLELLKNKRVSPQPLENGGMGIVFTEDKKYWVDKIEEQPDLDNVSDYKYSILMEIEIDAAVLNSMMINPETGRLSDKIHEYYRLIEKSSLLKRYAPEETNILCILDIYKSDENEDGLSQVWLLKVDSEHIQLWKNFSENIDKMVCIGGIPGAEKEALV